MLEHFRTRRRAGRIRLPVSPPFAAGITDLCQNGGDRPLGHGIAKLILYFNRSETLIYCCMTGFAP